MFTQCEKCKAIFRINLREVTVAKGKLRCGECYSVFDSTKTLSTSKPLSFQEAIDLEKVASTKRNNSDKAKNNSDSSSSEPSNVFYNTSQIEPKTEQTINKWLIATVTFLTLLLPVQMYLNMKFKESEEPLHEPKKIEMLNYNVFAHPNESGVLLISATMENIAKFNQPYPVIEVRLSDSKSKVIALRRFRPNEYLQNHKKSIMLVKNKPSRIKLKISDPGSKATRFQFEFH